MTDPISDFLTRLRNASQARKAETASPHSQMKEAIAAILKEDGFISDYSHGTDERGHKTLVVKLKYVNEAPAITQVNRVSTPGRRLYFGYQEIPRVLNGLGISILSTSRGLMNNQNCLRHKVGGELVCTVW
jgi:small subunit ribosomal protein S8